MILTIAFGIIGLGIMVFVHELGHFVAAKSVGIDVEVFSLGWGRKLVGFTRGNTRYQIAMFPVGGFCKMKGEDAYRTAIHAKLDVFPREEGAYYSASPWRRIVVALAGPLANILFAALMLSAIWRIGFDVYSADNRVILASDYPTLGFVAEEPGVAPPATRAGLFTGDRVLAIGGEEVEKFQDILEIVSVSARKELVFTVERDGGILSLVVKPDLDRETGSGQIGVYSWNDAVIETVEEGSAASGAGLQSGDRITGLDANEVRHLIDLSAYLPGSPRTVTVHYERDGMDARTEMIVLYDEEGRAILGLSFRQQAYRSVADTIVGAVVAGVRETVKTLGVAITSLATLFKGIDLRNAVAGPLRITYYVGAAASSGFALGIGAGLVNFFRFLCFLSILLFVMNLLPVPAFDGGQTVIFLVEGVTGRPLKPRVIYGMQVAGFAILIVLLVMFTFSDILYFIGR